MSEVINNLVDNILSGDSLTAKDSFEDAIALKITDALDKRKTELAQQLYSPQEAEESEDQETENEDE